MIINLKTKIDNSEELFKSSTTIADLANNCCTLMQPVESRKDFEHIFYDFCDEWKFEISHANYFEDVKFSIRFKDGSNISAETVLM